VSVSVGMSGCLSVMTNVAYLCMVVVPSVSLSVICVACDSTGLNRLPHSPNFEQGRLSTKDYRFMPAYGVPKSETADIRIEVRWAVPVDEATRRLNATHSIIDTALQPSLNKMGDA